MRRKKHSRRKRGLSAGHRSPVKRRRRRGLSAGFSKANIMETIKNVGLGAAGGAIAPYAKKTLAGFKLNNISTLLVGAAVGAVGSHFGAPKMSLGFIGGLTALTMNEGGLREGEGGIEEDTPLEELPIFQTDDGRYMKMLNDGDLVPLSEEELSEIVYPTYGTMNAFQQ